MLLSINLTNYTRIDINIFWDYCDIYRKYVDGERNLHS